MEQPQPLLTDEQLADRLRFVILWSFVVGALGIAALVAARLLLDVEYGYLTREPQSALGGPYYAGAFSNLGAVVWSVPMVACAFAASLCRPGRRVLVLTWASLLSGLLLADDLFLLHDEVYPKLGLDEIVVEAIYLVLTLALLVMARPMLGRTGILGLLIAMGLWGISLVVDVMDLDDLDLRALLEDGAKFLGIVVWAAVWSAVARQGLGQLVPVPPLAPPPPEPEGPTDDAPSRPGGHA